MIMAIIIILAVALAGMFYVPVIAGQQKRNLRAQGKRIRQLEGALLAIRCEVADKTDVDPVAAYVLGEVDNVMKGELSG